MDNSTPESRIRSCVMFLIQQKYRSHEHFNKIFSKSGHTFRISVSKTHIYNVYQSIIEKNPKLVNADFEHFCVSKTSRSHSGVCVISTIMAPEMTFWRDGEETKEKFTCKYDCAFCPNDPEQARSYPRDEPVPLRGKQNDFDVVRQGHSRMRTLQANNHTVDKLEWLILGGTWSSFPREYREFYHCSIFFCANLWSEGINVCKICDELDDKTTWRQHVRPMGTIREEMELNRKNTCRIIGITIETRPDEINLEELRFIRDLGCTRIQMGFQHTDNTVLKKNRRGCTIEQCMAGLRICMENGFKVDGHWMPDLPFSDPEKDRVAIERAFTDPELRCDQVKIYPTQVLDFTRIKKWYDAGTYIPYGETNFDKLFELIIYAKTIMPPWVRTNRIVRDFPTKIIKGGITQTHLHGMVLNEMKKRKIKCSCIRCREVKRDTVNHDRVQIIVREYESCGGTEYFISAEGPNIETGDIKLLGFCRLRLNDKALERSRQFPELYDCALVRELHVYGNTTSTGSKYTQHRGYGSALLERAEQIAMEHGWTKIAVISGIGVQDYYKARGYRDGFYMTKSLVRKPTYKLRRPHLYTHMPVIKSTQSYVPIYLFVLCLCVLFFSTE